MLPKYRFAKLLLFWAVVALSLVMAVPGASSAADERPTEVTATVESFVPQGTVRQPTQVRAEFSDPMIPFGDPGEPLRPFIVHCSKGISGQERWIDERTWAFDLAATPAAGEQCRFTLVDRLSSLTGKKVTGGTTYRFSTGAPAVVSVRPYNTIAEDQALVLTLDGPVDDTSVEKHARFMVDGIASPVAVRIVRGKEREKLIRAAFYGRPESNVLVLRARQRFPAGGEISFVWSKHIRSTSGVAGETDQTFTFTVRPQFHAKMSCDRTRHGQFCIPLSDITVHFSAPVAWEQVRHAVLTAGERRWSPAVPAGEGGVADGELFTEQITFRGPFPERAQLQLTLPASIRDDAGRQLSNQDEFPLAFATGSHPPLAKFAATFGIIEAAAPVLPITVRHIEPHIKLALLARTGEEGVQRELPGLKTRIARVKNENEILHWLEKVRRHNGYWEEYEDGTKRDRRASSIFSEVERQSGEVGEDTLTNEYPSDTSAVVGVPLNGPGFYVVEVASPKLGESLIDAGATMFVSSSALVTNLGVHFKWGSERSLVWVTSLDDAKPVHDAEITVTNCAGSRLWTGKTGAEGTAIVSGLPEPGTIDACEGTAAPLIVTARKGEDFSFVLSNWNDGIESWRFNLPYSWYNESPLFAHTIFARTLVRPTEQVHMKHLLRRRTLNGIESPADSDLPNTLTIKHAESGQEYVQRVKFEDGSSESLWNVPENARHGVYNLYLSQSDDGGKATGSRARVLFAGAFRVSEFRVPLMRAYIRPPATVPPKASSVEVLVGASYLAGGAASKLPVRLRYDLRPRAMTVPREFEGYTFANGPVKSGIVRRGADSREEAEQSVKQPHRVEATLDEHGAAAVTIDKLPAIEQPMEIAAELEYSDPNGEIQTVANSIPLWNAERQVGIATEYWLPHEKQSTVKLAVIDQSGMPVSGAPLVLTLFERKVYSHRKRLVGGFYAYEHVSDTSRHSEVCQVTTGGDGTATCSFKPSSGGSFLLQAETRDGAGNISLAHAATYASDGTGWDFEPENVDRIDLVPERKSYEPGEIARFQVRMPFQRATALVTVEREGVAENFVTELTSANPLIEVPIVPAHAPNVFVSALLVRGRLGDHRPSALADLGKPAYKLGIAEVEVGWKANQLLVDVRSVRDVYQVRDKAPVQIQVQTANGDPLPDGGVVAVAAVDEGLLELFRNDSWEVLRAFMGRRAYGVTTATGQMHVVGKRHFGMKGVPPGGGGGSGKQLTRELFDTLLLWQGRVELNSEGKAEVAVPLNDSLTSFRIVAIAHAGPARFGSGSTVIRSTQDVIIMPGIAPVVRAGDRINSLFTVRNTTDTPVKLRATGRITAQNSGGEERLHDEITSLAFELAGGASRTIPVESSAPEDAQTLHYQLTVDGGGKGDHVRVSQKVIPLVAPRVVHARLEQLDPSVVLQIKRPAGAIPRAGGVEVALAPSLLAGVTAARDYMERYPYTCLEQRVSQAVALQDRSRWDAIMAELPAYLDSQNFARYFSGVPYGSDVLTAYILSISHATGWPLPEESRALMIEALAQFVEGRIHGPRSVAQGDLVLRKLIALEALSRWNAVKPEMVRSIPQEMTLWPTSAVVDWFATLHRIQDLPDGEALKKRAEQILRSRLHYEGSVLSFASAERENLWWLMGSGDVTGARLVHTLLELDLWREELPRLTRGMLERQTNGAWDLTLANAWGVLAVKRFAETFESEPVEGTTEVRLANESPKTHDWSEDEGGVIQLPWPDGEGELLLNHDGSGRPWSIVKSVAAIRRAEAFAAGYTLKRSVTPLEQRVPGRWSVGDLARIKVEVTAQADRNWVVVHDPVPPGAAVLGSGLKRSSTLLTAGEQQEGGAWPAFQERASDSFRAYFDYVPRGTFSLEYTVRYNSAGMFNLPPTRIEALYAPEMFGELPNAPLEIGAP